MSRTTHCTVRRNRRTMWNMGDHLETYSALVSASEMALSAWLNQEKDPEAALHATNLLAFVLNTIDTEQLPEQVRRFRVVPNEPENVDDPARREQGRGLRSATAGGV